MMIFPENTRLAVRADRLSELKERHCNPISVRNTVEINCCWKWALVQGFPTFFSLWPPTTA